MTNVSFNWNKSIDQIVKDATGGDKTLLFATQDWHRLYEPFVPMDTGMLATGAVDHYVEGGQGIIHHKAPYANKMYNGDGLNFQKTHHPLATAHWSDAAKQAGKADQLAKEVEEFIKRGR